MGMQVRIAYNEFRANVDAVIDSVIENGGIVVVEINGRSAVVLHLEGLAAELPLMLGKMTPEACESFKRAAGSWADVDTEALIAQIYADREPSRPLADQQDT
jgi:PHD/YefM family antitoxin component YafN of YafNO toxin-antitoxin module